MYDKFLWEKVNLSFLDFGVSQKQHCGFWDIHGHVMWPLCPHCQSWPVWCRWPYTCLCFSRIYFFPVARSVDGKWKDGLIVTSSVSDLPAVGTLTQEIKSLSLLLSQEVIKNLAGSRFHGSVYHPDTSLVSYEGVLSNTSCYNLSISLFFDYSLLVVSILCATCFSLFSIHSDFFL